MNGRKVKVCLCAYGSSEAGVGYIGDCSIDRHHLRAVKACRKAGKTHSSATSSSHLDSKRPIAIQIVSSDPNRSLEAKLLYPMRVLGNLVVLSGRSFETYEQRHVFCFKGRALVTNDPRALSCCHPFLEERDSNSIRSFFDETLTPACHTLISESPNLQKRVHTESSLKRLILFGVDTRLEA